jgi:actin-related protein
MENNFTMGEDINGLIDNVSILENDNISYKPHIESDVLYNPDVSEKFEDYMFYEQEITLFEYDVVEFSKKNFRK